MVTPGAFSRRIAAFDEAISAPLALAENRKGLRGAALVVAHSGDSPVWAALLLCGWFFGGPGWRARVIVAAVGLLVAEIAVVAVKMLVRRQRPPGTSGAIYRRTDPYSFPSGHAARAAMLAIFSAMFGPPAAFIAILAWGPVMVLCRIAIGIHYVLDVIAGLVLGALLSYAVVPLVSFLVSRFLSG